MERQIGQQINGGLKHKEGSVCSDMVEAVLGIAALHIEPERLAAAAGASQMGMARDALGICAHKDTVVVLGVLIEQLVVQEIPHHRRCNVPVLHQIGKDPAGIGCFWRYGCGFGGFCF